MEYMLFNTITRPNKTTILNYKEIKYWCLYHTGLVKPKTLKIGVQRFPA